MGRSFRLTLIITSAVFFFGTLPGCDLFPQFPGNEKYILTIDTVNDGSVTRNPDQASYPPGTVVELQANPATGGDFGGWRGDVMSQDEIITVTMDSPMALTAVFSQSTFEQIEGDYIILVGIEGSGSINKTPDQESYSPGSFVILTATPDTGWSFQGWIGADNILIEDNPLTIQMDETKVIHAVITQDYYTLTCTNIGNGEVNQPSNTSTYHLSGTTLEIFATPLPGWIFTGWTGDASGAENPLTITMSEDKSIDSVFTPIPYTLDISTTGNGTVFVSPNQDQYFYDIQVELTAVPASGWIFSHWAGIEGLGGTGGEYSNPITINIDGSKSINTVFVYVRPNDITDLIATENDRSITLEWSDSEDEYFSHCEIWYGINGETRAQFTGTISGSSTEIANLIRGEEYTFLVKSVDVFGNTSTGNTTTGATQAVSPSLSLLHTHTDPNGFGTLGIFDLFVDSAGIIYAGTDLGLRVYDGETWTTHTKDNGLPDNDVQSIFVDNSGVIYVGTWNGLGVFDGSNWTTYTTAEGLAGNHIRNIYVDDAGVLYAGCHNLEIEGDGGLTVFDGSNWTTYTSADGLASNDVTSIAMDSSGLLYVGTTSGLSSFDGFSWRNNYSLDGLDIYNIRDIFIDNFDSVYVTAESGLGIYDGGGWWTYTSDDGLSLQNITSVCADNEGVLYIETWEGLTIFNGADWTTYTDSDGLPLNSISGLYIDSAGNLYVGSWDSLSVFEITYN
jgi:hypothetical protein